MRSNECDELRDSRDRIGPDRNRLGELLVFLER